MQRQPEDFEDKVVGNVEVHTPVNTRCLSIRFSSLSSLLGLRNHEEETRPRTRPDLDLQLCLGLTLIRCAQILISVTKCPWWGKGRGGGGGAGDACQKF